MKLYVLKRPENVGFYDEVFGFVIRAQNETRARELAAGECADEGSGTWENSENSSCVELYPDGEEGIIIRDFNAG